MNKILIWGASPDFTKNLWDQAFLCGCIENLKDYKITILWDKDIKKDFLAKYNNIEIIYMPDWKDGKIKNITFLFGLIKNNLFKFNTIYHLWADGMDWRWWKMMKLYWLLFLISPLLGKKLCIISFSFHKTYHFRNKFILKLISKKAHFFPRDSISLRNFTEELRIKNVQLVSDTSFLMKNRSDIPDVFQEWINKQKLSGKKILLFFPANRQNINDMSSFIKKTAKKLEEWQEWSVIIGQHIFDNETEKWSKELFKYVKNEKIFLSIQDVSIVRSITGKVDIVWSCLMHPGLWAIAMWKPVIVLDYFWKAKGLFQDLGLDEFIAENEDDFLDALEKLKQRKNLEKIFKKSSLEAQVRAKKIFI